LAENHLTTKEIKYKLLIATNSEGHTVWHIAAEGGEVDVLQEIWDLAKNSLTTDEI
jgi:hypothetical protein